MTTHELSEYQSIELEISAAAARDLVEVSGGKVGVSVGSREGSYRVTATEYVGTVVTPEIRLLIRPKVSLENLFTMLSVGIPEGAWKPQTFDYAGSHDLLAALSQLVARSVWQATNQGVVRAYRTEDGRLATVRGRIDIAGQIRKPAHVTTIACIYDEYTADVLENRYLKRAVRVILRVPGVGEDTRRLLRNCLSRFEDVTDVWVRPESLDEVRFTRLNAHYEAPMRLARLVLLNLGLLDRAGSNDASSFLLNMNELFQRFMTERLRHLLHGRLDVIDEERVALGYRNAVAMYPDLRFDRAGVPVLVGDLKYKLAADARGRSSDYYQLLAYATALGLQSGVLIYCTHDGDAPTREVVVRNAGTRLLTYAVPMAGSATEFDARIRTTADWIGNHGRLQPDMKISSGSRNPSPNSHL
jgi:5-methylcytosine-specific restriction enzyme subunit McrC